MQPARPRQLLGLVEEVVARREAVRRWRCRIDSVRRARRVAGVFRSGRLHRWEAFDGNRTIADAVHAAGFKKNDKALLKQLEGFLERCARADFLTFRKRLTSSD